MPNIISKLKDLWKANGRAALITPVEGKAAFRLMYEDLEIGQLRLSEGIWRFTYSEAFKAQARKHGPKTSPTAAGANSPTMRS